MSFVHGLELGVSIALGILVGLRLSRWLRYWYYRSLMKRALRYSEKLMREGVGDMERIGKAQQNIMRILQGREPE